jgi:hypothetical protein
LTSINGTTRYAKGAEDVMSISVTAASSRQVVSICSVTKKNPNRLRRRSCARARRSSPTVAAAVLVRRCPEKI